MTQRFDPGARLGRGAFAVVHRAYDRQLEKNVAVKAVSLPADEVGSESFTKKRLLREVGLLRTLKHPNIISLYDSFEEPNELHLILELLEGCTLAKCLAKRGALREAEAAEVARQLVDALAYMHSLGVIHRDVKPENIMSAKPIPKRGRLPPDTVWKIFDFGLGRNVPGGVSAAPKAERSLSKRLSRQLSRQGSRNGPMSPATPSLGPTSVHASPPTSKRASSASIDELTVELSPSIDELSVEIRGGRAGSRPPSSHSKTPSRTVSREASLDEARVEAPETSEASKPSREPSSPMTPRDQGTKPELTTELSIGGSRGYMAPELGTVLQKANALTLLATDLSLTASPSLDMWSLGKLLHYCCTGIDPALPTFVDAVVVALVTTGGRYRMRRKRNLSAPARRLLDALAVGDSEQRATAPAAAAMVDEWLKVIAADGIKK